MNIKELFITFEQAKALKALNFNEQCIGLWVDGKHIELYGVQFLGDLDSHPHKQNIGSIMFQQVVNWSREEHNLELDIYHLPDSHYNWTWKINDISTGLCIACQWNYLNYSLAIKECIDAVIEVLKK